jgi:hypothetical protein
MNSVSFVVASSLNWITEICNQRLPLAWWTFQLADK